MSRHRIAFLLFGAMMAAVFLLGGACSDDDSAGGTPATTASPAARTPAPPSPEAVAYTDPFAYCRAVDTVLHPDARYVGDPQPAALVRALERAMKAPVGAFDTYAKQGAVAWRCAKGAVLGCVPGANLQCWEADTSRAPTDAMKAWCTSHPGDGSPTAAIPASVTGHATVYEWRCAAGGPTITSQVVTLDDAGLNSRIWYAVTQP